MAQGGRRNPTRSPSIGAGMDFSGSHPCHANAEVLPEIPSLRRLSDRA